MSLLQQNRRGWATLALIIILFSAVACAGGRPIAGESGNAGPVIDVADGTLLEAYNFGGYTSKVSVAQGESLAFHLSSPTGKTAKVDIFREGATRQLMTTINNVPLGNYDCTGGYTTGCGWPAAFTLTVPTTWPSGVYIANVDPEGPERSRQVVFWVREDNPGSTARLLFLSSVNTHQAYNDYGGGSLYGFGQTVKAEKVSFNRPFLGTGGKYSFWEAKAIPWLESRGYKVEYATTYDLHFQPDLLSHYDVAMVVGHSEYWSWDARRQLEAFVAGGGRFLSLAGNVMWWQIRYEDDGRTLVGYKNWKKDPEKAPELSTDNPDEFPILDNPIKLTGLYWPYGGYPGSTGDGYYAVHTDHWIYEGTGVTENQLIGKGPTKDESIHDKESDGMPFNCAADGATILGAPGYEGIDNFTVLGLTTVYSKQRDLDNFTMMGLYTTPAGGAFFSAGTTGWALGLNQPVIDRITRNVLDRFLAGNFPAEPRNPDTTYLIYDRFNCYDVGRSRFPSTLWRADIARNNFVEWTGGAAANLTTACGVDGSGLEIKPGGTGTSALTRNLRPDWAKTDRLYSRLYLNLAGLKLNEGQVFTVTDHTADNRQASVVPIMELQVRRQGGGFQMRYQPVKGNLAWLDVPADRFFMVETGFDKAANRVALWIDGAGYEQTVDLSAVSSPNRLDLGVIRPTGGLTGAYCLDELKLDDQRVEDPEEPTPTPSPTPKATVTTTPEATPTVTATPEGTPTPTETPEPPPGDERAFVPLVIGD